MHQAISVLKNALGYAKIEDEDINARLMNLVDELGTDLEELYEPGNSVDVAVKELEEALNATDSEKENAIAIDDEDDEEIE